VAGKGIGDLPAVLQLRHAEALLNCSHGTSEHQERSASAPRAAHVGQLAQVGYSPA